MQPVGGAMEGAEPTGGRRGVTGMDQCRGKRAGEQRRDRPPREIHMLCRNPTQGCGKQCHQHEPREPIMSEGGVEKHRRQNAIGKNLAQRALADLRTEDDGARQRQSRRIMDHAYKDQRITHPVPPGRRRAPNSRRTYFSTRKVYSPFVEWASTEVTRHSTL